MWEIRLEYLRLRGDAGRLYDFDDIAGAVSAAFDSDDFARLYRHVIIDEGQDMSPEMIRSLTKAVPPDGSVTFFGDVAQQIYGRGISWRDAGMRPAKTWEFRHNEYCEARFGDFKDALLR
jgi:superfamily I DNA/RNA helicase